ncbi:hypothetical protein PoB_006735400 [Plakobranchus ocellatus]|uniref:Uncharacterized protein n=1 Tax=Plakobranchus ocellatus TaxID=259542 RepID=A0AAV4D9I7_9GAST|nr:hypothetical protein PoB_006735400 [Plakobranchus ocellatus]
MFLPEAGIIMEATVRMSNFTAANVFGNISVLGAGAEQDIARSPDPGMAQKQEGPTSKTRRRHRSRHTRRKKRQAAGTGCPSQDRVIL